MRIPEPSFPALARTFGVGAALLVGLGLAAWRLTGHGHLGILGFLAGLTCVAAIGYYWLTLDLRYPHGKGERRVSGLAEDAIRAGGIALPVIAGAAAGIAAEDWRWTATGLLAGAFLPGLIDSGRYSLQLDGPGGVAIAGCAWMFVGALVGPLAWLWTFDPLQGALGFGIPVGIGLLFFLAIALAVNG